MAVVAAVLRVVMAAVLVEAATVADGVARKAERADGTGNDHPPLEVRPELHGNPSLLACRA